MTMLPAQWFGLRDRGTLRAGAFADVVVFDPVSITDRSTFSDPIRKSEGIDAVIVNGEIVWEHGSATGRRPGRVLARDPALAIGS
jgi:N-acyl-D-amino-acid deacylase